MIEVVALSKTIAASRELVFRALTEPFLLKQWLCDECRLDPRTGGQFFISWNDGAYVVGRYTAFERSTHLALNWYSSGDSSPTQVDIQLSAGGELTAQVNATRLDLIHSGFTSGDQASEFKRQWQSSLDALAYMLQTGLDYRVMSRPMIGIMPLPVSETDAERLGLPSAKGVILSGVVAGGGAEAAGLKKDDVLLKIGATPVDHPSAFPEAVKPYKGGDVMPVEIYRAGVTSTVEITLGKRPVPEMLSQAALADQMRAGNVEVSDAVAREIAGVPEELLDRRPEPDEWSVREILAHLVFGERFNQMLTWRMAAGDDLLYWSNNGSLQLIPLLAASPTAAEMLEALRGAQAGSLALIEALPASVVENKAVWGIVVASIGGANDHVRIHLDQIHRAIEAAQAAAQPAS